RGFAAADASLARIHAARAGLLILGDDDLAATEERLRQIRGDARTRPISVGVVRRSVSLEDEERLRRAGANVVFGGGVVPYLWDAWLEELLSVPPRRDVRVPVSIAVWSHTAPGSDPGHGETVNISVKGLLLETAAGLDIGAKL